MRQHCNHEFVQNRRHAAPDGAPCYDEGGVFILPLAFVHVKRPGYCFARLEAELAKTRLPLNTPDRKRT